MKRQSILLAVLTLFFVSNNIFATIASFQGLGDLPGGEFESYARAVSSDGSDVVGLSYSASGEFEAFRWEDGQMVGLGDLPGGSFFSSAYGISADGSVVVGLSRSALGTEAFHWKDGIMTGLGDLPGREFNSWAFGVSADGSVVVGHSESASGYEAFRWENGQMVGLGDLPGGSFSSSAFGVSADGSIVVGWSSSALSMEAFRWKDLNGNGQVDPDEKLDNHPEFGLGDLPGGGFSSSAFGVSADGSVVVGYSKSASGSEAFRWEDLNGNGQVDPDEKLDNHPEFGLGDLPGGDFHSWASDVSADGLVVVGAGSLVVGASTSASDQEAVIWDADNGMRSLKDVLRDDFSLDMTGWHLYSATGISDDGLTIVGKGINPDGYFEGWIATIPEPATILLLGLGATVFLRRHDNR